MILLHLCCAPCTIYPLKILRRQGIEVHGYFYNPNIHPFREFENRLKSVQSLAQSHDLAITFEQHYGLVEYLRQVVFNEHKRCHLCYQMRLTATALHARALGAEAFSTTLLYSRFQRHELIREIAEAVADNAKIPFYYHDFRDGWQEGQAMAKQMALYRQAYCGCIFSEQERYDPGLRRRNRR